MYATARTSARLAFETSASDRKVCGLGSSDYGTDVEYCHATKLLGLRPEVRDMS